MNKEKVVKVKGRNGRTLFRVVCVLCILVVLTACSVSGVYAKYVDSTSSDSKAGVARLGVEKFNLLEHKVEYIGDKRDGNEDVDGAIDLVSLYRYKRPDEVLQAGKGNEYKNLIPGIDIPKDPFIQLELKSNEVSYELYVQITEAGMPTYELEETDKDGKTQKVRYSAIIYNLTEDWEEATDANGNVIYGLYKFTGNKAGVKNGIFRAGTEYNFTFIPEIGSSETSQGDAKEVIHILKNDMLKVSQYFNSEPEKDENGNPLKDENGNVIPRVSFSMTFTAYLQQVINLPTETPEESGDLSPNGN
ncbi:MAG: hypothetical protein J1F36_03700 [Clostridiales bacterium]|nr:hypothetical protein [Clostridiales bacterium]